MIPGLVDPDLLRTRCFVDGAWVEARAGHTLPVADPATGRLVARVPSLDVSEVRLAVEAAHRAFGPWRERPAHDRAALLRAWFDLVVAARDDLARILTTEQGKPLAEARGEVSYAAAFLEWFGEEAKRVYGDVVPSPWPDRRIVVLKQPVGVVGAITPWNFPAAMFTRKAGAALAAGCTVVAKPASHTPLTALALAALAERAGLPPGVLNVVIGPATAIGAELTSHPLVRKITFTGSTEVGRTLLAQAAGNVQHVSLELGGNAPFLVFDDADLEAAVEGALASKYRNSGQTCVCANRFLVQNTVHDAFVERLAARVARLVVGPGLEPGVEQGPLIDRDALARVEAHVADAVARGARVVTGGQRHPLGGTFYDPTVLTGVTPEMRVTREETFGPVAPVLRFETEAEAIRLANDTPWGLAAYLYGRDLGRIWRVAEALESGMVGVNTGILSTEVAPFGGVKLSGLGREGSKYGIEAYLEVKYVCLGGI